MQDLAAKKMTGQCPSRERILLLVSLFITLLIWNKSWLTWNEDICYNLRYFEKHGRDLQDPWSCRQSVVHQKYAFGDATSALIVIQPSRRWETGLDDVNFNKITHPLALHLRSISPAVANNWEYLEYMSNELLSLVSHFQLMIVRDCFFAKNN
jgi:hypothetical protein